MPSAEVDGDDNEVQVAINGFVARLGVAWLTHVVQNRPGAGWRVAGTTGSRAISKQRARRHSVGVGVSHETCRGRVTSRYLGMQAISLRRVVRARGSRP